MVLVRKKIIKFISRIIETLIYYCSGVVALYFLWDAANLVINNWGSINACIHNISDSGAVFTISSVVYTFIAKNRAKRLEQSIKLVEDFDKPDFREARDLTRIIKEPFNNGEITGIAISNMIEFARNKRPPETIPDDIQRSLDICQINYEECYNLRRSLIFVYNYWDKLYYEIIFNAVDEDYIKRHMAEVYINQYKRFEVWINQVLSPEHKEDLKEFNQYMEHYIYWKTENVIKRLLRLN